MKGYTRATKAGVSGNFDSTSEDVTVWGHSVTVWWPFWAGSQALITLKIRFSMVFLGFSHYKLCLYGDLERRGPKRRCIAWITWNGSPIPADVDNSLKRIDKNAVFSDVPLGFPIHKRLEGQHCQSFRERQ